MSDKLLPCPFCEGQLEIEYVAGTCIEYVCLGDCGLVCGSEQICDFLTIEERNEEDAYNNSTHEYAPRFVERVKQAIAIRMNTRAPQAASEDDYALIMKQSELLTRSVNLIKGEPPELTHWSHHDLPEIIEELLVNMLAKDLDENLSATSDSVTISREILVDISETLDIGVARALARKALEANHTK
jgi:hypothetical protein